MKKYILLDWDGTLAKTLDIWLDACRYAINEQGVSKSDEEISSSFGQFPQFLRKWGVKNVQLAIEDADKIAKKKLPNVELYPDALFVLEELKKTSKTLALITTSPLENIEQLLVKYELMSTFDVIIHGDDVKNHKPHPESLELALRKLSGTKEEAIMIGDSDKDVGASTNAGIDSILFYPPEHRKFYDIDTVRQLKPTFVISDFKDIIQLVG